jgi:hypothetical protein
MQIVLTFPSNGSVSSADALNQNLYKYRNSGKPEMWMKET